MARIRSVHPSLFTDEAWVSCSPLARLLYIGLWTDADDQGLFEWKPLQIKMRLLPGDMADAVPLLAELVTAELVLRFDHGGKPFGAIKQFRKYQRPKKPNATHVLPDDLRTYVGLTADGSELDVDEDDAVPPQFPTGGENAPQMEDGGGRGRGEVSDAIASSVAVGDGERAFEDLWKAYPHFKGRSSKPKSKLAWEVLSPTLQVLLPAAATKFRREGQMPPGGAPALDKWLGDERYNDWLFSSVDVNAGPSWPGPTEVRQAFAAAHGEDWVRSYIDPSGWRDVPERAIVPATARAALKITQEGRSVLAKLNLTVLERAA